MQVLDPPTKNNNHEQRAGPDALEFRNFVLRGQAPQRPMDHHGWLEGLSDTEGRRLEAELRAQGTDSLSSGGFWVSDEWRQEMLAASEVVNPWRGLATPVLTDSGADLGMPAVDDTANEGQLVAEPNTTSRLDVPASRVVLRTVMLTSGLFLTSWALVGDLGDRLGGYLASVAGRRIERRLARSLSTGVGGIDLDGIWNQAQVGVTAAATGAVTADEIMRLIDSADESWRFSPTARLVMRSATFSEVRRLRDGSGALAWQADPTGQSLGVVAGVPVLIDKNAATMATGNRSLLYVDLAQVYIRDVRGAALLRLNELYAGSGQVGWIAFGRFGGGLMSVGSVAAGVALQQAAS